VDDQPAEQLVLRPDELCAGFDDLLPHADRRIEDTPPGSASGFDHREARAGFTAQEIGGVQA